MLCFEFFISYRLDFAGFDGCFALLAFLPFSSSFDPV
jgi:hypothetical protein